MSTWEHIYKMMVSNGLGIYDYGLYYIASYLRVFGIWKFLFI